MSPRCPPPTPPFCPLPCDFNLSFQLRGHFKIKMFSYLETENSHMTEVETLALRRKESVNFLCGNSCSLLLFCRYCHEFLRVGSAVVQVGQNMWLLAGAAAVMRPLPPAASPQARSVAAKIFAADGKQNIEIPSSSSELSSVATGYWLFGRILASPVSLCRHSGSAGWWLEQKVTFVTFSGDFCSRAVCCLRPPPTPAQQRPTTSTYVKAI